MAIDPSSVIVQAIIEWIRPVFSKEEEEKPAKDTIAEIANTIIGGIGFGYGVIGFSTILYQYYKEMKNRKTDTNIAINIENALIKELKAKIEKEPGFAEFIEERIDDLYEEYKEKLKLSNLKTAALKKAVEENIEFIESTSF